MVKGIIIYIDGVVETRKFDGLADYQNVVGGLIESMPLTGDTDAFINEEGKLMCEPNVFATFLAQVNGRLNAGDFVAGNMIVVGKPDEDGNVTDVPDWVIDFAKKINAPEKTIDETIKGILNEVN